MSTKYTKEVIESAVAQSTSWAAVCRLLGVKPLTGSQTHLKNRATRLGIDTPDHFLGAASNRGRTFTKRKVEEYLFNGVRVESGRLRKMLVRDGYKDSRCEICGLSEWMGSPIPLELDHMDSNHFNNELSNLQIVCPNCHAMETKRRKSRVGANG